MKNTHCVICNNLISKDNRLESEFCTSCTRNWPYGEEEKTLSTWLKYEKLRAMMYDEPFEADNWENYYD